MAKDQRVLETLSGVVAEQKAFRHWMEKMSGPAFNAAELINGDRGSGPRFDRERGWQPTGKRWNRGVGMGDFLGVLSKTMHAPNAPETEEMMKKLGSTKSALAEQAGVTGGYTVPPEMTAKLLMLAFEDSLIMPHATVVPMLSRSLLLPSLDVTTRYSAGQSPFLGGVKSSWTEEAATRTETEPQFRQTELIAHELSGYTLASNTLLQDNAIGLDALLSQLFTQAVAWDTDFAFFQGNSVGKPLGIMNAPATAFVQAGTAGQIVFADICGMYARLLPQSYKRAMWAVHPTALPYLLQLQDGDGNNVFLPRAGAYDPATGGPVAPDIVWQLFGRPVHVTEKLPLMATGSAVKQGILLFDPGLYLIGMRMEIEIAASIHFKFTNNQTTWRYACRVDGRPWLDNTIRLQDGTSTLAAFVGLINAT